MTNNIGEGINISLHQYKHAFLFNFELLQKESVNILNTGNRKNNQLEIKMLG